LLPSPHPPRQVGNRRLWRAAIGSVTAAAGSAQTVTGSVERATITATAPQATASGGRHKAVGRPHSAPQLNGLQGKGEPRQRIGCETRAYRGPANSGEPFVRRAEVEKTRYFPALPPFSTGRKNG
jgi:hypothetical protein